MKIIYLSNARIPTEKAHGIQIMKMCEALAHAGHEVELVIPRRRNQLKEDPFDYFGIPANFTITRLPTLDLGGIIPGGFLIQMASFIVFAAFYLRSRRFDILYSREFFAPLLIPCVFEMHVFPKRVSALHRTLWKRVRGFIVITNALKRRLMEHGIESRRIHVAPDAVDISRYGQSPRKSELRAELNLPPDKALIIYTGHLYDWKGAEVLAHAARFLSDGELVVMVGGTAGDVERFQKRHGGNGRLLIRGHKPHGTMPRYHQAADILVLPSTAESRVAAHYTSPMKLFEYMASGTPIVASDLPSIREIVDERMVAFFKPDDARDLAGKIQGLLHDPAQAAECAAASAHAVQKYTWQNRCRGILDFLDNDLYTK